jgi:hypothetical protein
MDCFSRKPKKNYSFTPKPLDTENKGRSSDCYQIVIKGAFAKPESLDFTGFFGFFKLFPLAK